MTLIYVKKHNNKLKDSGSCSQMTPSCKCPIKRHVQSTPIDNTDHSSGASKGSFRGTSVRKAYYRLKLSDLTAVKARDFFGETYVFGRINIFRVQNKVS